LDLAQRFPASDERVYTIPLRGQGTAQLDAFVYLPNPAAPNQSYTVYVIVQNRGAHSFAVSRPTYCRLTRVGAMALPSKRLQRCRWSQLAYPLCRFDCLLHEHGTYHLDLHVTSGAIGDWSLSGDVAVLEGEPAHLVVLPARVVASTPMKPTYAPGEVVEVKLSWLALNKIDAYYSASVRILDTRGEKIAQQDREPVVQTLLWKPGDTIPDRFEIVLPPNLTPGEYTVQVRMYQANQGIDALMLDEKNTPHETTLLGTFSVK